ncbi:hypothetical protein TBLA_0A01410 [Henningerozyma blattae CBS 6284]|uniref:Major facilitator superfamily (MFS) profile domain-containing protein n=1 Tax=Henningerozyma blattae (strain ATCC 34711 / CBS 6284 / DSM 70876 / NBRC 10599 / NRRL Y-10934 / UCD 77-7) TaxID=1071380 RepID=I2GUY8_HENB6|nr:hypothetical protein TBLA_0A01410 [Tetrapisispora blattae CBS 6284]CCH57940.1 hypothetical protein TBLA_0A01410 [Tetrapisispora blattae CBS 6284]
MAAPKLTFKQQMSGFPWAQLLVVSLVRFSEPIAFTSLFPYVYFMVKDFHIAPNDAQVSKYSGYLSSTFSLCQVLAAFHWGRFADRGGRKITLVCGLIGTSMALLTLGFAKHFYQALLARSMMGLLNGNVGVIRTIIGELATERRHQAIAFSTMPLLFQFGSVIGPMIGGFLVFRQQTGDVIPNWYPNWLRKLITIYPYCLPNIVISCLLMFGMFCCIVFLEETHPKFKDQRDRGIELGDWILKVFFGVKPKIRPWQNKYHESGLGSSSTSASNTSLNTSSNTSVGTSIGTSNNNSTDALNHAPVAVTENTPLIRSNSDDEISETDSIQSVTGLLTRRQSASLIRTYSIHEPTDMVEPENVKAPDGCTEASMWHHVFHTPVFYPISINFIQGLHLIVYNEFLPVFLAYDLAKDPNDPTRLASKFPWKITGGIGYTPEQTGTLLSSTGIFGCFVVLAIFPYVDRNYDCLTIFRTLVKFYPIMYIMIPYVIFLQVDFIPRWVTILYLYTITGIKTLCGALTSPQIMLLIHHNSPLSCRASINGATISISASARFIGPLAWGFIMAWSQQNDVAWLSWWTLGFFAMVALYQSYKIAPIDEEDNTTEQENSAIEDMEEDGHEEELQYGSSNDTIHRSSQQKAGSS